MCDPETVDNSIKGSVFTARIIGFTALILLISLGVLSACGQRTETNTVTVPVDTTVVDDDTLEVDDTVRFKQTERAR